MSEPSIEPECYWCRQCTSGRCVFHNVGNGAPPDDSCHDNMISGLVEINAKMESMSKKKKRKRLERRTACLLDNHEQQMRLMEHQLMLLEIRQRETRQMLEAKAAELSRDIVRSIELTAQFAEDLAELRRAIKTARGL